MKKLYLVIILTFLMNGCSAIGLQPGIQHHQQNTVSTVHPRAQLVAASTGLVGNLDMVNVRFGTVGQLQRAEISVQNLSNKRYSLEYLYSWKDQQGFAINQNVVWRRFTLAPREIKSFQSIGPTPDAYKINMTVRLPDDIFIHQDITSPKR